MVTPIEAARLRVALAARRDNEHRFADEVLAGAWDDRSDIRALLADPSVVLKGEKPPV